MGLERAVDGVLFSNSLSYFSSWDVLEPHVVLESQVCSPFFFLGHPSCNFDASKCGWSADDDWHLSKNELGAGVRLDWQHTSGNLIL